MSQIFLSASEELFHPMLSLSDEHILRLAEILFREHLGLERIPSLDVIYELRQFKIQNGSYSHLTECPALFPFLRETQRCGDDRKIELLHLRPDAIVVGDEIVIVGRQNPDHGRADEKVLSHPLDAMDPILDSPHVVRALPPTLNTQWNSAIDPALLHTNAPLRADAPFYPAAPETIASDCYTSHPGPRSSSTDNYINPSQLNINYQSDGAANNFLNSNSAYVDPRIPERPVAAPMQHNTNRYSGYHHDYNPLVIPIAQDPQYQPTDYQFGNSYNVNITSGSEFERA